MELLTKVAVLSQHFPQAENRCIINPVFKLRTGDLLHLRATAPDEFQFRI